MHRAILMHFMNIFHKNRNTIFGIDSQILEVVHNIGNSMFGCKVFDIEHVDLQMDMVLDAFPGEELGLDILLVSTKLLSKKQCK